MPESFSSPYDAAAFLTTRRNESETNSPGESAPTEAATPETESAPEADAAQPEEAATSETDTPAQAEPPATRELPRSWKKDLSAHWNKLDPATQDFLIEQDSKASAEIRRLQNDAAELRKGLTAKEQAAEKARTDYETQAKQAHEVLMRSLQTDFGDIQTMADVIKLQATDPIRFQQWQVHQMQLQAAQAATQEADARAKQKAESDWNEYANSENDKFEAEYGKVSKEDREALGVYARDVLKLSNDDLNALAKDRTAQDHRFQRALIDAAKYHKVMQAGAKVTQAAKPIPPVQRPGTRVARNGNAERQQALSNKLDQSGDMMDAFRLLVERRGNESA